MSDFDVDKLTLSCLVNRKHHKHLGDTFSTDMFSPKTSYIEEAIQETVNKIKEYTKTKKL